MYYVQISQSNQHKSRPVQKATGTNVGREKNKSRHAIETKSSNSQIIISANREHQAQENVYTYFFYILIPATGVLASCIFPSSSVLGKSRLYFPP